MLRIGHRGAAGHEPENTLRSFRKALELGVDMIELDVHRCKTGELVVIHDMKVDRTTNGKGYVSELSFEEIRKLDIDGEKIPKLQEVLDLVDRKVPVNIEIKSENTAKEVHEAIENYIKKGWRYDDFLVSSFNHYALLAMKKLEPKLKLGLVIVCLPIGLAEFAEKFGAYSIHTAKDFVNKEFVEDAHRRGIKVFVFVGNDKEEIERMKKIKIDGIFSDYPDRI